MGFGKHFMYAADFSSLETGRLNVEQEKEYISKSKYIYKKYLTDADELKKCCLGIRLYRAKKEIFCSAQMYTEAEEARKHGCMTAFYFLCYYALMHAMEGVLFLNTYIEDEKILNLAHRSVQKYFEDFYCKGRRSILSGEIIQMLEKLRTCREYYSYKMPWNMGKYEAVDMDKLRCHLAECFQLINLQNMVLFSISHGVTASEKNEMAVITYFANCCCKLNPNTHKMLIDDTDQKMLDEFLKDGIDYSPPSITYEHDFDEYGGYDFKQLTKMGVDDVDKIRQKTLNLVYRILV